MTAPITPDERAAMRALADAAFPGPWTVIEDHVRVHGVGTNPGEKEASVFEDRHVGTADARFIAAARTAVPRLLDALDTAEALAKRLTPPCDGGCSYETGPAEECSAHGRPVGEVWDIVSTVARERDEARAEVARLLAERTAAHADDATCASCTHEYVADMEKRAEEADAKAERQRDRLRAREEQVRRLRAEVTRLHALVADLRTAPGWDEDTVTEAVARAMFPRYFTGNRQPLRVFTETRSDAELREDERESERRKARQALAVVREHLPVRAEVDREALRRFVDSFCDDEAGEVEHVMAADGTSGFAFTGGNDAHAVLRKAASALCPGESRAQVQAEALWEMAATFAARLPDGTGNGRAYNSHQVAGMLTAHADRLKKGADRG